MQGLPEYVFQTTDGRQVRVFSAAQEQKPVLSALLDRATPERQLTGSQSQVAALAGGASIEMFEGSAWIAVMEHDREGVVPVAAARYQCIEGETVEVSVVVRDDMQGRGIGSRMLYFLLDQARAAGIRMARTSFESSNEAAWQVLQYSPYHITWQPRASQVDVIIHLQARVPADISMN